MPKDKLPYNPNEVEELDEDDIEIVDDKTAGGQSKTTSPKINIDDLYTFVPDSRGSVPITLDPTHSSAPSKIKLEVMLMYVGWESCHIAFPSGYRIEQKEWQTFADENSFSVFFMANNIILRKKGENPKLAELINAFRLLEGTGIDIRVEFLPQKISFRLNER